jgi:hypothetical protein
MAKDVRVDSAKLRAIIADNPAMVDEVLRSAANEMLGDIVLSFNTSPPGREYERGGVVHVASAEDYPPNVDTGALRASMNVQKQKAGEYWIQDGVEYGLYLEEGTERMGARPFIAPVFDEWRGKKFEALAADVLRRRGLS